MTTEPLGDAHQRPVSAEGLAGALEAAGVRAGNHLAVGISMGAIGRLVDGPDTIIQGLLLAVSGHGTVMLNAYTDMFPLRRLRRRPGAIPVFDRDTPANTGAVANRLLTWPGAVRSAHPQTSFTALGRDAAA